MFSKKKKSQLIVSDGDLHMSGDEEDTNEYMPAKVANQYRSTKNVKDPVASKLVDKLK